jgi:hypothetical protein
MITDGKAGACGFAGPLSAAGKERSPGGRLGRWDLLLATQAQIANFLPKPNVNTKQTPLRWSEQQGAVARFIEPKPSSPLPAESGETRRLEPAATTTAVLRVSGEILRMGPAPEARFPTSWCTPLGRPAWPGGWVDMKAKEFQVLCR